MITIATWYIPVHAKYTLDFWLMEALVRNAEKYSALCKQTSTFCQVNTSLYNGSMPFTPVDTYTANISDEAV